jgi:hypothetical protein
VSAATVDVEWTLPNGSDVPQSRTTNAAGWAVPLMLGNWPGEYKLCITNATHPDYHYDASLNWETCTTITLP